MPRAKISLASLPAEILQEICLYLSQISYWGGDIIALKQLIFTCQRLYKFVLPHLYHDMTFRRYDLFLLVRTFLERPELALDVRTFSLHRSVQEANLGKAYTLLHRSSVVPRRCKRYLHPKDSTTINLLLIEVLLLQLKKVEDLSISADVFSGDEKLFSNRRWKQITQLLPAMKTLVISLHPFEPLRRRDLLSHVQVLLSDTAPSKLLIETDCFLESPVFRLNLPNLQTLDIMCQGMKSWELKKFLNACPNLTSFIYHGGTGFEDSNEEFDEDFDDDDDDTFIPLDMTDILDALEPHKKSLTKLDIGHYRDDDNDIVCKPEVIPSLHEFSSLTDLSLNFDALIELDNLDSCSLDDVANVTFLHKFPPSLERLSIFKADDRYLEELRSITSRTSREFPKLKVLTLEWWRGKSEYVLEEELTKHLAKADIKLVIQ